MRILYIWVCLGECSQHESTVTTGHPLPCGRMRGHVPWSLQGMRTFPPHNALCTHPQTLHTDFESKLNFKRKCQYDAFKPFCKIQTKATAYSWMHAKKKKPPKNSWKWHVSGTLGREPRSRPIHCNALFLKTKVSWSYCGQSLECTLHWLSWP